MKRIIVFILLVIPYFAFSQEITVNKKWIDRDSCWVFTSFNSIGVVGNDTLCESGVFTISLPKSIKFYCETPNKVLFVFPKNQSLLIEKVFNHNSKSVTKDTTIHNYDDICLMISRFTNNCGNNRFYKRMNKIVQSKSFINKRRVSSLYMKDGYKILIFNIKRKEYKYFLDMLNSFKDNANLH